MSAAIRRALATAERRLRRSLQAKDRRTVRAMLRAIIALDIALHLSRTETIE